MELELVGHIRSDDLVKSFNDELNELDLTKLIQISMDGPNSNLKFLSEIKKLRIKDELACLTDIGCCNLQPSRHSWSIQTVSEGSSWNLHKIVKGSFTFLHDIPAC